ncbi:hypothetical protein [Microbacterium sp. MRS-1]|uniref:hypothetical protein n=1 Tax=Microbacterium sp. MRS-1 TaxID=1451261 RepID=UPI00045069C3|nr:hypothetical protein [Microbacterium sp. MRS-1]EXJ50758.1 hypothetical protein AS96_13035 [Microbacterium sp. MRS-1]
MNKKKTILSCGATVAAFAIILAPVGSALAADEVTTEPTTTVSIGEETTVPADAPAADETPTANLAAEGSAAEEVPVEPTVSIAVPEVAVQAAPVENQTETAARAVAPLISTDGLTPIGTGVFQPSPAAPPVEYDRYMPSLHDAFISGVATPEGNRAPDEVELNLRSLVGITVQSPTETWQESGFRYSMDGALAARPDTGESANVPGFSERIDWSEFAFDVTALPRTGIASDTTAADGKVRLVAFDQNSTYGVTVALRHIATGVTSAPVTITGRSGMDGASTFAWVGNAPTASYEGGIPMWSAADRVEWRNGRYLTWGAPRETITPTGARTVTPSEPRLTVGQAPLGTPAGFGLTDYGTGPQTTGQPSYRVGELTGELTKTVSIDLAERIPGVTAVALPSAEDGTLALPATDGLWSKDREFIGLDYNAPEGLTVTVSGTVVTFDFGSAEWLNAAGINVPVLLADGTRATAEVRTESLPRDIAGGLVEKRIPVETPLFISDEEMLAASRLTGLSPSMAEVQAVELPDGVQRVSGGFEYEGSTEPTALSFGFTVAETVDTEFGPVRPDVAAPGEVRIAVVAGETPVTPEPEAPVTPQPKPEPSAPAQPQTPAVKPNPRFETGDSGPLVASENVTESGTNPALLTLGAAGGLGILGLLAVLAARLRRRSEG